MSHENQDLLKVSNDWIAEGNCSHQTIMDIRDYAIELERELKTCRESALREAAEIASMFSINKSPIHPDLTYEQLKPEAQLVLHTTCQHVSDVILAAIQKKGEK